MNVLLSPYLPPLPLFLCAVVFLYSKVRKRRKVDSGLSLTTRKSRVRCMHIQHTSADTLLVSTKRRYITRCNRLAEIGIAMACRTTATVWHSVV